MAVLADWELKILVDALQALIDQEPWCDLADDDFDSLSEFDGFDEADVNILTDMRLAYGEIVKSRRKAAQQAWRRTEAGKAASKAWNESCC